MAKLYFRYGVMGSSKSAQALITKFNYEEQGMRVWLIKPAADTRYGKDIVRSRIGLEQTGDVITEDMNLYEIFRDREKEFNAQTQLLSAVHPQGGNQLQRSNHPES